MAQRFNTPITIDGAASAASQAVASKVDGDTQNRLQIDAGGKLTWGDGSSAGDTNLYRSAADALKTDDTLEAAAGLITLTTSGAPTASLSDGALAIDTTNDEFYIRSGGAWVKQGGGGATQSDTAPSNPVAGDLWYETDTGAMYVYYDSVWIEVGTAGVIAMSTTSTPPSSPGNGDLWFDIDTARTYVYYDDGSSQQWIEIGAASAAASGVDGAVQFASGGTFASDASNFYWDDTNNRLGVGTASPTSPLHIKADSYDMLALDRTDNANVDQQVILTPTWNGVNTAFAIKIGSEIMRVTETGNVGIGTNAPNAELDIRGASNPEIRLQSTDSTDPFLYFGDQVDAVRGGIGFDVSANALQLRGYDNSTRMTIDSSGNVGIGTVSPAHTLDVSGDVHISSATPDLFFTDTDTGAVSRISASSGVGSLIIDADINNTSAGTNLVFRSDGTERIWINSSGKVGIGTISPVDLLDVGDGSTLGSFRVHATGGGESFRVTGTVVRSANIVNLTTANAANVYINTANNSMYRSTSSAKYKTDIETLEDEYADIVFELRPVWYRSTTGNDPEEYSYYGLIAEEVAQFDPRLGHFGATADCGCVEDEDGHIEHEQACLTEPEGVFYERLVPHLINVVQRQGAQIDALTARIEALEAN